MSDSVLKEVNDDARQSYKKANNAVSNHQQPIPRSRVDDEDRAGLGMKDLGYRMGNATHGNCAPSQHPMEQ